MAQTTPNFGFNIAEGTDTVNLLTQCYPNFTSLDSILQGIKETGVTAAIDTKVGTVHQLVRTDTDCIRFSFVATGNYNSGDTFTVDGVVVTATAMDGTALPQGAFVINQSVMCILNGTVLTIIGVKGLDSVAASGVSYDNTGSGLTATNAQDAIDEVETNVETVATAVSNLHKVKRTTFSSAAMTAGLLDVGQYIGEAYEAVLAVKLTAVPVGFTGYTAMLGNFPTMSRVSFLTASGSLITGNDAGFSGIIYYV